MDAPFYYNSYNSSWQYLVLKTNPCITAFQSSIIPSGNSGISCLLKPLAYDEVV